MNLQQLYEILILNGNDLIKFKYNIREQAYRDKFFKLFPLSKKEINYRDPSTGIVTIIDISNMNEKNKDTQIKKLIEIWNEKQREIKDKKYHKGFFNIKWFLGNVKFNDKILEESIQKYFVLLLDGINWEMAEKEAFNLIRSEFQNCKDDDLMREFTLLQTFILKINRKLTRANIEF